MNERKTAERWALRGLIAGSALFLLAAAPPGIGVAHAKDAWLGVSLQEVDEDLREALDLDEDMGVMITGVAPRSPAERSGLEEGDVVLSIDGDEVTSPRALVRRIERAEPEDGIELVVLRDGERVTAQITLGARPARGERSFGHGHRQPRIEAFPSPNHPRVDLDRYFSRPRLGVETRKMDPSLAAYFDVDADDGVLVLAIIEDTPAEAVGLEPGDVILRVAGEKVRSTGELRDVLLEHEGESVTLDVKRQGKDLALEVELERPVEPRRSMRSRFFPRPPEGGPLHEELETMKDEIRALREEVEALREAR